MNIGINILNDKVKNNVGTDRYIKDGLLYCNKCNTPKQTIINWLGTEKIVYCMCKCENEKYKQEQQKIKDRELFNEIERMKIKGIQDKDILNYTFENAESNNYINIAKRYCSKWEEVYKNNTGLLLWGDVGTGKTFIAGCIANYLLNKRVPVLMTNFTKIINELQGFNNNNTYIKDINKYKLLIIDDLGAERQSDYALEKVFNIIDARYKNGQPMIITTNLSLDEIKQPDNIKYKRIYDRVLEMCIPIKFAGESRRINKSKEKNDLLKGILKG